MNAPAAGSPESAPGLAFSVVRGQPTDTELAAVVAVLYAVASAVPAAPAPVARSAWADRSRDWYPTPRPGPAAWRASALPR